MSRRLASASNQNYATANAVVSALPLTFCGWFNSTSISLAQCIVSITTQANGTEYFSLELNTDFIRMRTASASVTGDAITTATYPINKWQHATGTVTSNASRAVYLNGQNKVTNATSVAAPVSLNTTALGIRKNNVLNNPFDGLLAHLAIWNIVLSDRDIYRLGVGDVLPPDVHPEALVGYWPLNGGGFGTEYDLSPISPFKYNVTPSTGPVPNQQEPPIKVYSEQFLQKMMRRLNKSAVVGGNIMPIGAYVQNQLIGGQPL